MYHNVLKIALTVRSVLLPFDLQTSECQPILQIYGVGMYIHSE